VKDPRSEMDPDAEPAESGFGGFLRGLLSGIPWSERAESDEVFDFACASGNVIKLHNVNGRTRVRGEDRENVEVRARKTARAESAEAARRLLSEIRIIGEDVKGCLELEVLTPRKWNRRGHAALEVAVPRAARIEVSAPNGKVHIESVQGGATVRSSNGSACIHDVIGDIDISTSNARVQCSCCCGHLIARSSNGKIELDRHKGSVDATTSNGLIRASVEEVGKLGVQLATSNGRIVLGLPEDVHAELDLWVDNGIIRNDRELESATRDTRGRVLGRIGGGGALIKLRTSNGSISVR
jgi:DUF4097 and DUF4098 domain-containing protein YvlB